MPNTTGCRRDVKRTYEACRQRGKVAISVPTRNNRLVQKGEKNERLVQEPSKNERLVQSAQAVNV